MEYHVSTLYRHLEEAGVSTNDYTLLTNDNLDQVVTSIKVGHPNDGEVLMRGHLSRMGIRVTRQQLRDSIHRVDHELLLEVAQLFAAVYTLFFIPIIFGI